MMASLGDVFSETERTNWLKAWLAIDITKEGLQEFVDQELLRVQTRIIQIAQSQLQIPGTAPCTNCSTANLLRCPTQGICRRSNNKCLTMHDTPAKQPRPCPNNICDVLRGEIENEHRYSHPSWKNTEAEQWARNSWQIAKCFLPPDGYIGVRSAQDTDFNGIINVMLNCKHFNNKVSFIITTPLSNVPCLLNMSRDFCKAVRHTTDCKVTDDELKDMFTTLTSLLNDPHSLANDQRAQKAVLKLRQLENDNFNMADVHQLMQNVQESLQNAARNNIQITTAIEEMKDYMKRHEDEFNKHVAEQKQAIVAITQPCIQSPQKEKRDEEVNYALAVEEFLRRLIQHYNETLSHVGISPLMPSVDKPLSVIYVKPKIQKIETGKDGKQKKTDRIQTYKDLLTNGSNTLHKHIFLQGEPGMGKSIFAAKIVQDWCTVVCLSAQSCDKDPVFNDVKTLQTFKFVFHMLLRESNTQHEVLEMIKYQIIDNIYHSDERANAYQLLQQIMMKETCLVVQDGLDEWADPDGKLALPLMLTCIQQCTVLITTRHWRLTDERIKDSQIHQLLELEGVDDPFKLSKSILHCLNSDNLDSRCDEFKKYIGKNKLNELLQTPMLLSLIVCSWVDDIHLTGSKCFMYSILLDGLFKKANDTPGYFMPSPVPCFIETTYLQPNNECLDALSKAAFVRLFSSERKSSLVFSERELLECMSKEQKIRQEQKIFALKSGVITERKSSTLTYKRSTYSFIHKSVQEFLAAYHFTKNEQVIDNAISDYLTKCNSTISDVSLVFKFLCGLDINAAKRLSRIMNESIMKSLENNNYIMMTPVIDTIGTLQSLIVAGYEEAKANGFNDSDIQLELRYYDFTNMFDSGALKSILITNTCNVHIMCNHNETFKISDSVLQGILRSSAYCIKVLIYADHDDGSHLTRTLDPFARHKPNYTQNELTFLKDTSPCNIDGLDMSLCRCLQELVIRADILLLSNALSGLEKLKRLDLKCKCDGLDLSSCPELVQICINEPVILSSNGLLGLQKLVSLNIQCKCDGLDLNSCPNLEQININGPVTVLPRALQGLQKLRRLTLQCKCDGLDLSSCPYLMEIDINEPVTLLSNALQGLYILLRVRLHCYCDGLDLSSCPNLEAIDINEPVTLLSNPLRGLKKLKWVILQCKCDGLDLSSCTDLVNININGPVTLLSNALRGLKKLERVTLQCKCDGLDLSSCPDIMEININEPVTLLPNALHGLQKLRRLTLQCKCDGLDLSSCPKLENVHINRPVILLPNALQGLHKLVWLYLQCKCDELDLSSCPDLQEININGPVTLLSNALRGLKKLQWVTLQCKCDGLDLSSCPDLVEININGPVTLVSNALRGLMKLERIKLQCICDALDVSSFPDLKEININEPVTLLSNSLRGLKKLEEVTLQCKCDGLDLSSCPNLVILFIKEPVTLLQNGLQGLQNLQGVTLQCKCDGLDLTSCPNLVFININGLVTLLPNALRGLEKLKLIYLKCKYDGLDFPSCHSLQEIKIKGLVTLLPNALQGLQQLERVTLQCKCDGLDLSSCPDLVDININGPVSLLPNALRGLEKLKRLYLKCKCDGLDLSSCHSLEEINIKGLVTLLPNALQGLQRLRNIKLQCTSNGLDLSLCPNLVNININGPVILLPKTLQGLHMLTMLTLQCKCDGLDLSSCPYLETLDIKEPVTLLPNALQSLQMLTRLTVQCKCDGLDLSYCQNLTTLDIKEPGTLFPKALHGLPKLTMVSLRCRCDGLDVSTCQNIETMDIGEHVALFSNDLHGLQNLKRITLMCTCDRLESSSHQTIYKRLTLLHTLPDLKNLTHLTLCSNRNDPFDFGKRFLFPQSSADIGNSEYFPLPTSIQEVTVKHAYCSISWLSILLTKLSSVEYNIKWIFRECKITSSSETECSRTDVPISSLVNFTLNKGSKISLTCYRDSPELCEALYTAKLTKLNLYGSVHVRNMSQTLNTLTNLETVRIAAPEYMDICLPKSLSSILLKFSRLSTMSLRDLLDKLSSMNQTLKCRLVFYPTDPLYEVKQELDRLENVHVKSFLIGATYIIDSDSNNACAGDDDVVLSDDSDGEDHFVLSDDSGDNDDYVDTDPDMFSSCFDECDECDHDEVIVLKLYFKG